MKNDINLIENNVRSKDDKFFKAVPKEAPGNIVFAQASGYVLKKCKIR